MQVTMRGYARDHGSWILVEEALDQKFIDNKGNSCPEKRSVLEQVIENDVVTHFSFRQRVRINMNGNYVLEITLTAPDVAKLCWQAFRNGALSALLRIFGSYERAEIEVEEMVARQRELRQLRSRI